MRGGGWRRQCFRGGATRAGSWDWGWRRAGLALGHFLVNQIEKNLTVNSREAELDLALGVRQRSSSASLGLTVRLVRVADGRYAFQFGVGVFGSTTSRNSEAVPRRVRISGS